jgi:hypothetical protein
VLRSGEPIENCPLSERIDTGITYGSLLPGMVPEFEERLACMENNYSWREWQKLSWHERGEAVAFYRLRKLVEMHQGEAVSQDMKRRQRTE